MPTVTFYRKKRVPKRGEAWSDETKISVVQAYILLGQLRLAAASCNIPEPTVKVWRATQWWRDTEQELRRSSKLTLSAKLSDVIQKAIVQLNDRLENGDFLYNAKTGEFIRKPVSAEHVNKITTQLIDRTLILEKAAQSSTIDDAGLDARLKKLKAELIQFAKKPILAQISTIKEEEIIDVTMDRNEEQDISMVPKPVLSDSQPTQQKILNNDNA